MLVVGLCGPMGAGKSAVLRMLCDRGAVCLRADDASRELLAQDSRSLAEVREQLGSDVFADDGSLDRARTAALIFRDAEARRRLERLLHPRMVAWLQARLEALRRDNPPPAVVVIEAAILTHMGLRPAVDVVVRVWAGRETCLARLQARDGVSAEEAARRLALHEALGLFDETADFVVDTPGSMDETEAAVERLWEWLGERGVG